MINIKKYKIYIYIFAIDRLNAKKKQCIFFSQLSGDDIYL